MLSLRRYLANLLIAAVPPTRAFRLNRLLWVSAGVSIGPGSKINSGAKVWGVGALSVGADCWLGMNLVVIVPAGAEVRIGDRVDIGPDVLIECGSHEIGGPERRAGPGLVASADIGPGTWIGCRVTILGGARIGAGSVVAAGAVVLPGEYPQHSLLAGAPAKVLRTLDIDGAGV